MDANERKILEARLERIRSKNGGVLTPDDVVKDARSEASPLHSFFEWDDSAAAHQYRLEQARTLIRNVRVEVTTSTSRIMAPFYVRDPRVDPAEQGYCSVAEIRTETEVACDALRYEFDRAISLLERAVTIADALGLAPQVQELLARAKVIHEGLPAKPSGKRSAV